MRERHRAPAHSTDGTRGDISDVTPAAHSIRRRGTRRTAPRVAGVTGGPRPGPSSTAWTMSPAGRGGARRGARQEGDGDAARTRQEGGEDAAGRGRKAARTRRGAAGRRRGRGGARQEGDGDAAGRGGETAGARDVPLGRHPHRPCRIPATPAPRRTVRRPFYVDLPEP